MPPQQNTPTPPFNTPPVSPFVTPPTRRKKRPFVVGIIGLLVLGFIVLNLLGSRGADPNLSDTESALDTSTALPSDSNAALFLISANIPPPKGWDLPKTEDFLTKNGATLFVYSANWDTIEPSPNQYAMKDVITAAFKGIVPKYPFKGVVLILKMIDSNVRTMPPDLKSKAFDDPAVEERFLAMLHAVATSPGVAGNVHYILLGNEVDGYFEMHPKELSGFVDLLHKSIDQLHLDLPGVQVGTITRFDSLKKPELFRTLTQHSDFIDYTYYPLGANWRQRPVSDVPGDIAKMAAAAGSKHFGFTEIGYSASPKIGSSDQLQVDFMKAVFENLHIYRDQVAFINWAGLADSPDDVCQSYARSQGLPDVDAFCAYAVHNGLRTYDNVPRPAWDVFVQEMQKAKAGPST